MFTHVLVCWDNRYWVLRIRLYTWCSLAHTWKTAQKATSSIAVKCDAGLWRLFPVPLTGRPASIPRMCTAFPLKKWFTHNWNLAHSRLSRAWGCSDYYLFFLLSFTLVKCLKLPVEVWEAAMCFGIFKWVEEAVVFRKCSLDFDYRFIIYILSMSGTIVLHFNNESCRKFKSYKNLAAHSEVLWCMKTKFQL